MHHWKKSTKQSSGSRVMQAIRAMSWQISMHERLVHSHRKNCFSPPPHSAWLLKDYRTCPHTNVGQKRMCLSTDIAASILSALSHSNAPLTASHGSNGCLDFAGDLVGPPTSHSGPRPPAASHAPAAGYFTMPPLMARLPSAAPTLFAKHGCKPGISTPSSWNGYPLQE